MNDNANTPNGANPIPAEKTFTETEVRVMISNKELEVNLRAQAMQLAVQSHKREGYTATADNLVKDANKLYEFMLSGTVPADAKKTGPVEE